MGMVTGGIMLKDDFNAAPRISAIKSFMESAEVKPGSSLSPSSSPIRATGNPQNQRN